LIASDVKLTLAIVPDAFAICRFDRALPIPAWSLPGFFTLTRTQDELAIVRPQAATPRLLNEMALRVAGAASKLKDD